MIAYFIDAYMCHVYSESWMWLVIIINTHLRGFFDIDLHEVQLTEWRSVSKKPFKMLFFLFVFVLIPHLKSKYSRLILSKLSRKSAICPRRSPWLLIVLVIGHAYFDLIG